MDLIIEALEVHFRGYRLDTVARVLTGPDGSRLDIGGRAFDVLVYLIRHRPRVVGKDELMAAVWPGRVVEENNLTQAIGALRRALGTSAGDREYIVTVPGRGYSFVAEVEEGPSVEASTSATAAEVSDQGTHGRPARARFRFGRWHAAALLFLMLVAGATAFLLLRVRGGQAASADATIAVLPFHSLNKEGNDPLLEIGLADTLITRLSRSTHLRVLSLASTQAFAGPGVDPDRAGSLLGADYVVEGHVQRLADRNRITVRLLDRHSGRTLWADTLDRDTRQLFRTQDEIAAGVAHALGQPLAKVSASPCYGADADAYHAYLRGRYLLNRPNPRTIDAALEAFRQATRLDPGCARAWAGIAAVRRTMVMVADHDPRVEFPLSDAAIDRALAIDPDSAEAWAAKGFNAFWYHWSWRAAETDLRKAIALDPNLVDAHFALAHLLNNLGRHDEAQAEARRAAALDPMSPLINTLVAWFIDDDAHRQEAKSRIDRVLELEPDFWIALEDRAMLSLAARDGAAAERDALHAVEQTGRSSRTLSYLAMVYLQTGRSDKIRPILKELDQRAETAYVLPSTRALLHLMLAEPDQVMDLLEQGYRNGDIGLAFLTVWFRPLADNPRYTALVKRMHLPAVKPEPVAAGKT